MKFVREKGDSLMGKTVVRHTLTDENGGKADFYLEASRTGLVVKGNMEITTQSDLQEYAKTVSDAWTDHRKLVPKITKSLVDG